MNCKWCFFFPQYRRTASVFGINSIDRIDTCLYDYCIIRPNNVIDSDATSSRPTKLPLLLLSSPPTSSGLSALSGHG